MTFAVLTHHRSGSNFLTDALERDPQITLINEPFSMHTRAFKEHDLVPWDTKPNPEFARLESGALDFAESLFATIRCRCGDMVRGFKETILLEKLAWVEEKVPDIRIILGVRDPRAVVNSVLNHPQWRNWGYESTVPRYLGFSGKATGMSEVELIATSWLLRYREALEHLTVRSGVRWIPVRLEDVVLDPAVQLRRISRLLDREPHPNQLAFVENSAKAHRGGLYSPYRDRASVLDGWKRGLTAQEVGTVCDITGELMGVFGYER